MNTPPVFFSIAVDWLTLATYDFTAYTDMVAEVRRNWPARYRAAKWLQYDGWKHPELTVMFGKAIQSNDREHYIVKVSGSFANEFCRWFLQHTWAEQFYCTRIDIQRTRSIPDWWDVRILHDELHETNTVSMIQSDTGSTLYLGSRTSDRFTRFYEKQLETKYLRLEIELKGKMSRQAWQLMLLGEDVADCYHYHVLKLRVAPFIQADFLNQTVAEVDWQTWEVFSHMQDKLKWLQSLTNTFQRMANDHDIGYQVREIFYSLSIDNSDKQE